MALKDELTGEAAVRALKQQADQEAAQRAAEQHALEGRWRWFELLKEACLEAGLPEPKLLKDPEDQPYLPQFGRFFRSGDGLPILVAVDDILLLMTKGGPIYRDKGWGNSEYVGGGALDDPNIYLLVAREGAESSMAGRLPWQTPRKVKVWVIINHFACTLSELSREKIGEVAQAPSGLSRRQMQDLIYGRMSGRIDTK